MGGGISKQVEVLKSQEAWRKRERVIAALVYRLKFKTVSRCFNAWVASLPGPAPEPEPEPGWRQVAKQVPGWNPEYAELESEHVAAAPPCDKHAAIARLESATAAVESALRSIEEEVQRRLPKPPRATTGTYVSPAAKKREEARLLEEAALRRELLEAGGLGPQEAALQRLPAEVRGQAAGAGCALVLLNAVRAAMHGDEALHKPRSELGAAAQKLCLEEVAHGAGGEGGMPGVPGAWWRVPATLPHAWRAVVARGSGVRSELDFLQQLLQNPGLRALVLGAERKEVRPRQSPVQRIYVRARVRGGRPELVSA